MSAQAATADIVLRELACLGELTHAEHFQREVWGEDDKADNADLLLALQHEGALVAGAFRDERMLGFLFGFPTRDPERQHSHRLGVHPDSRGIGLGARLKWFQRDWCLERGIARVGWTFDPLLGVNAALNIERLGGTAELYLENRYGAMPGINAGTPSDRLLVDWALASPEVERLARGEGRSTLPSAPPRPSPDVGSSERSARHRSTARRDLEGAGVTTVAIPADIVSMLVDCPAQALAERHRVRAALQDGFASGLRITRFDRSTNRYTLTRRS